MKRELRGRRVLITGASGGIGRAIANAVVAQGAQVALMARSGDKLQELARTLSTRGDGVLVLPGDVTSENDRRQAIQAVVDQFGGLDVLINNAGISSFGHFATSTEAVLRQIMEVNFFAPAELIRLAIPVLVSGHQPAVVNVSSMCGRRGMPAWSEYSASKFALCGLTEALRAELARFDIDVLLIVPGLTSSDMPSHLLRNEGKMKIEFGKGMAPDYVADQIVQVIRRNRAEKVLGSDARWMLRAHKFFPRLVNWLIARRVMKLYSADVIEKV